MALVLPLAYFQDADQSEVMYSTAGLFIRHQLLKLGKYLPLSFFVLVDPLLNYLFTGFWIQKHSFYPKKWCRTREEVFDQTIEMSGLVGKEVLYLEFGVYRGESIQYWATRLPDVKNRFHGFDSFEGLNETWNHIHPKGIFALKELPKFQDSRIELFKGYFDQSLPQYTVPSHTQLVVNIDCDLYSSTIFVLNYLKPFLKPGTVLYFDELNDRNHEMKALDDFLSDTNFKLIPLVSDQTGSHFSFLIA